MSLNEARPSRPLPPGTLAQAVTWLEMTAPPPVAGEGRADLRLEGPERLEPETYRALYRAIGERWLWWERLVLDDRALAAILNDRRVEIRLLHVDGETAGYSEIDRRDPANVEIAFLGLKPARTGRALGRALLADTLRYAWKGETRRVWLHTCDHDHPAALGLYLGAGFRIVRRETVLIDDPRLRGLLPLGAAPHVPLACAEP